MRQLAKDPGHHGQVLEVVVGLEQRVALHSCVDSVCQRLSPIAQMADIGFKVVLLERLNQKWKQKHF